MRIFFSHAGRDKSLVREICSDLPAYISPWVDEKKILAGEPLEEAIKRAIRFETEFVVLVVTPEAVRSDWVKRELEWALEREKQMNRAFVIPILLDPQAWWELPEEVRARRYLPCTDFSRTAVRELARRLSRELIAWLERGARRVLPIEEPPEFVRLRVQRVAGLIVDDQASAAGEALLTADRLEMIVEPLELERKVELLFFYELGRGGFRDKVDPLDLNREIIQIDFLLQGVGPMRHEVDWMGHPDALRELQYEYGLGNDKYYVRNVFLDGIEALSVEKRRKMFSGIEIVSIRIQ